MNRERIEEWAEEAKLNSRAGVSFTAVTNSELIKLCALALRATDSGVVSLQNETGSWAEQQFPESTPDSVLNHAREEFMELVIATTKRDDQPAELAFADIGEESADVVLLIMPLCHKLGIDLEAECRAKLARNKKRKWDAKPNAEGYYKHVAQEDQA